MGAVLCLLLSCLQWWRLLFSLKIPTVLRCFHARRLAQLEASGDRRDILAIDGNCKLHRRTCGMPFAEVVSSPHLNKFLLRGCSAMPHGRDTLCRKHAADTDRDRPQQPRAETVAKHRLKRALHREGDVCHLEVKLEACRGWQPACTVREEALANYFASKADRNIRRRRERRIEARSRKWTGFRPRRARSFLGPWHSAQPRQTSSCKTHKESPKDVHAAARTAGYLFAVTESGLLLDMLELIGAESLSQRYHFTAQCAQRLPSLRCIVHDDACHLKAMCIRQRGDSPLAGRLADFDFVIDDFHAGGHTGEWCKEVCLPSLQQNKEILNGFPTEIAETANSQFSPLGHCFHHYGPWFAQLALQELADVHNLVRLQALQDKKRGADKKRKRESAAEAGGK